MYNISKVIHFCNVKLARSSRIDPLKIGFYDLTMLLGGRLIYTANGERLTLGGGDVILLPPNTLRARLPLAEPVHYISFNFYCDEKIALPTLIQDGVTKEIRALFDAFTPSHLSDELRAAEKSACIITYILEALEEINERKSHNPHINQAIEYIYSHMSEHVSLSAIAKHLHLSREYTAALFKRETGMTLSEFTNERKLAMAVRMIREGEMPLCDIARELGYENYGYFSRLFKERYGSSPTKFKN